MNHRVLSLIAVFFLSPLTLSAYSWNAYFLSQPDKLPQVHRILESLGPVMSPQTATVAVADFNELAEIPIAQLKDRLMDQDPRWDPYMKNVMGIFNLNHQGREGVLFYLPENIPSGQVQSLLEKADIKVTVIGNSAPPRSALPFWLYTALWIIFALVLVFQYRRRLFLGAFAGLFMFGIFLLSSGELFYQTSGLFFLFLEGLFSLFKFFRLKAEGQDVSWRWNSRRCLTMGSALAFLLILGIFQGLSLQAWGLFLLGIAICGGLLKILASLKNHEVCELEHKLFKPMRLTSPRKGSSLKNSLKTAAIFLLPLIPVMLFSGPLVSAPVWTGSGTLEELGIQWETDQNRTQPTASQYAAHLAFQDSFMFGGTYGFPKEGQQVKIRSYERSGNRLLEVEKPMITFGEQWFSQITSKRPATALERIYYQNTAPREPGLTASPSGQTEGSLILPFLVLGALAFLGGRLAPPALGSSWYQGHNLRREFLV